MPICPTSEEFWPEYNVGLFAPKLVDSIFSGQSKKGQILSKKKNSEKFCSKVPLVPTSQEFRPECNFVVFAQKPANSIYSGPKRKWKILSKEKKI